MRRVLLAGAIANGVLFLSLAGGCDSGKEPGDTGNGGGSGSGAPAGSGGGACTEHTSDCLDDQTVAACVNGAIQTKDCTEACGAVGFNQSTGCTSGGCACGEPADVKCSEGMENLCRCSAAEGHPCDDAVRLQIYATCFQGEDADKVAVVQCYADRPGGAAGEGDSFDCAGADQACLPLASND